MSTYMYKGVPISALVSGTGGTNPGYINFPPHGPANSDLGKPFPFLYSYQGTDISNYCSAVTVAYGAGASATILPNNVNAAVTYKHVSAFCVGGGGGGGGGGGRGYGSGPKYNAGAPGGKGGDGGYAAIFNYPFNSGALLLNVGNQGSGGGGGSRANIVGTSGGDGKEGDPGNASKLQMMNDINAFLIANGGKGGAGGGGGNANSPDDGVAANGGSGNGYFTPGYTGYYGPTIGVFGGNSIVITPAAPADNQYGGPLGAGGGKNSGSSSKGGDPGGGGYAQVWYLFQ